MTVWHYIILMYTQKCCTSTKGSFWLSICGISSMDPQHVHIYLSSWWLPKCQIIVFNTESIKWWNFKCHFKIVSFFLLLLKNVIWDDLKTDFFHLCTWLTTIKQYFTLSKLERCSSCDSRAVIWVSFVRNDIAICQLLVSEMLCDNICFWAACACLSVSPFLF